MVSNLDADDKTLVGAALLNHRLRCKGSADQLSTGGGLVCISIRFIVSRPYPMFPSLQAQESSLTPSHQDP